MSAEEAYAKIQAGQAALIKDFHVSKYYTWGDVLKSETIHPKYGPDRSKTIPLTTLINAQDFSKIVDKVSDSVGMKVPIESWVRVHDPKDKHPLPSNHIIGVAVDFKGKKEFLHDTVYNAVRRIPEIKGIGESQPNWPEAGLHIDNGNGHMPPPGFQRWFIDNPGSKTGYGSPTILKIEPETSKRNLDYQQ